MKNINRVYAENSRQAHHYARELGIEPIAYVSGTSKLYGIRGCRFFLVGNFEERHDFKDLITFMWERRFFEENDVIIVKEDLSQVKLTSTLVRERYAGFSRRKRHG